MPAFHLDRILGRRSRVKTLGVIQQVSAELGTREKVVVAGGVRVIAGPQQRLR